jgi:hypothetical protein
MEEKQIRIYAYEKFKKELLYKFRDAFSDAFCNILENNVDEVLKNLKARENAN